MGNHIAAVDFETTYDKECSIKPLGWDAYFRHPMFECYLVAIKTSDGMEWVGHPKDAPWDKIAGHIWISHNAAFDENLYLIAQEEGWWGDIPTPPSWECTMDLMAFCGEPHSLKNAVKSVFNVELSKVVRDSAAGKRAIDDWPLINEASRDHWEPMKPDAWQAMLDYALDDSVWCLKLWEERADNWPELERWLSRHTRAIARRGVPVDIDLAQSSATGLKAVLFEFENCIPWNGKDALLSRKAFDRQCKECGLTPPKSLAQDNAEAEAWLEDNEGNHEWIYAYRNWRKANALLKKVEAVVRASRPVGDHYRYFGQMKYCGAHTKRWSGSGGNLNMQNPPKGTQLYECGEARVEFRFRDFFRAPKGYKMAALDLSQIEVRTLTWLAGDTDTLKLIEDSPDIYQAFAVAFGLWSPEQGVLSEEDNDLRQMVKAVVLGSGFGASAWAFADKYPWALEKGVATKYGEDEDQRRDAAMEWLESMKTTGCWWWKKASRLLKRNVDVDVKDTTASGKEFISGRPQWKEFAQHIEDLDKELERYADVPIDLDAWEWDIQSVLIMKEATYCVDLYRSQMPYITKLWKKLGNILKRSVMDRHMEFLLPSENKLVYRNVKSAKDEEDKGTTIFCTIVRNGSKKPMRPWYGLLTENLAQSLARDVFAECIKELEDAGFEILFHVHDEAVVLLPEDTAEQQVREAESIMSTPPSWIPTLPLGAEGNIGNTYADCK